MRNLHLNIRKYDQPFNLLILEEVYENGIRMQVEQKRYLIYGSIMQVRKTDISSNERIENQKISVVFPNPPFFIDSQKMKIEMNDCVYSIVNVDFNQLSRGDVKVEVLYESRAQKKINGIQSKFEVELLG